MSIKDPIPHEDDFKHTSNGWSLTVGDLKKMLADMPDDYEVMIDEGDCEIASAYADRYYDRTPMGSTGILVLGMGQVVSSEYDYHNRLDVALDTGLGDSRWDPKEQRWIRG